MDAIASVAAVSLRAFGWLAACTVAVVALAIVRNWLQDPYRRFKPPSGTRPPPLVAGLPLLGIVHKLLPAARKGSGLTVFSDMFKKYGETFRCKIWGSTVVYTINPDVAQHVVSVGFRKGAFHKGEYMRNKYRPWLGDGIFTSDGEAWKKQRAFAKALFHSVNMQEHVHVFQTTADTLVARLGGIIDANGTGSATIDMQDYFMRYTLDTFVQIGMGTDAGAIGQDQNVFQKAFDVVQSTLQRRHLYGVLYPIAELGSSFPKYLKYMNNFSRAIIDELQGKPTAELEKSTDLLSRMLVLQRQQQAKGGAQPGELVITAKLLRDSVMNFLVAGRDTTAVTLSFCVYLLSQHPDVEAKVLAEFQEVVGDAKVMTLDLVRQCRYTKQVLHETLRLYPPVPGDGYEATRDEVLPGNLSVAKGQRVYFLTYLLQRQASIYPEPELFNPDRWARGGASATPPTFLSFHGGPRICLGMDMAIVEATVALWVVLRQFRFRYTGEGSPQLKTAIILTAKHGMNLEVSRR